jgi:hypothetical protein
MSNKLWSTDLFHCLHKNFVVSVCKINDKRENISLFSLNCIVAMCMCSKRIKNIDHMRLTIVAC